MKTTILIISNLLAYYVIYWCIRRLLAFARSVWHREGLVVTQQDRNMIEACGLTALLMCLLSRRDS